MGPLGLIKKMTSFQITTITTEFENADGVEAVYVVGEEGEGDVGLHHLDGWDEIYSNQVESWVPGAGIAQGRHGRDRCWAHGEQTEPTALARM